MLPELFRLPIPLPGRGIGLLLVAGFFAGMYVGVDRLKKNSYVVTAVLLVAYVIVHRLLDLPIWKVPINSYGASIMVGFLLATYVAIYRMNKMPWKLDLAKPGNLRLIADDLANREKIKPESIPAEDPLDLAALGVSEVAQNEAIGAVTKRKNSDFILDLAIISMIFGLLGGKIIHVLQYPDQIQESFHIFDISDGKLHPLGALLGAAPLAVFFWITRRRRIAVRNVRKTFVLMSLATLLFAVAGARAYYIDRNPDEFRLSTFRAWQSGFVLYGGLVLGFATGIGYILLRRRPLLLTLDLVSPPMLLGIGFGRIGCFLNGCCFGKAEPGFPFAIAYGRYTEAYTWQSKTGQIDGSVALESLPVHPVQLYETAATIILFFVLSKIAKQNPKAGIVTALTLVFYAVWRFFIEFLRDDERPKALGASFSQWVSLGVVIFCVVLIAMFRKREVKTPELVA